MRIAIGTSLYKARVSKPCPNPKQSSLADFGVELGGWLDLGADSSAWPSFYSLLAYSSETQCAAWQEGFVAGEMLSRICASQAASQAARQSCRALREAVLTCQPWQPTSAGALCLLTVHADDAC